MKNLGFVPAAMLAVIAVARFSDVPAAVPAADIERQIQYAQCVRANGYADFPDPGPDGRTQLRVDPKGAPKFEAAQRACRDKLPPGIAPMEQDMTPERLQVLLGFAACVRGKGMKAFPDPSPKGVFEIGQGGPDLNSPQAKQAIEACVKSNPPGGLMIRVLPPK